MTARSALVLSLVIAAALGVLSAPCRGETNLNFVLGGKTLDADDWPQGNDQGEIAFLSTFGPERWPVQVAIDLVGSGSTESSFTFSAPGLEIRGEDLTQSTFEVDVGVRKIWQTGRARPFVGGGLAVIYGRQERILPIFLPAEIQVLPDLPDRIPFPLVVVSEDDTSAGVWIDGGVFWRLGKRFNLGLEARLSSAELDLNGRDVQAGGFHLGLLLGWGW